MKANRRVDRDFFDRRRSSQPGPRRIASADLKKKTRCANCGEKGHWAENCRKPCRSKQDILNEEKGSTAATKGSSSNRWAGFSFSNSLGQPSYGADFRGAADLHSFETSWASFSIEFWTGIVKSGPDTAAIPLKNMQGHALIDTAAGQALIGRPDVLILKKATRSKGFH
eukprot:917256-Pyramimonas_sp.AAC.1